MAIFRGTGGTGDSTTDTTVTTVTQKAAEAASSATSAANSATSAANSASSAFTSETNAATSETNAANSATASATSATASETAKTASEAAQTAAETAEANAETAEANAVTAKNQAVSAKDNAVVAQTAAETAETNAETAYADTLAIFGDAQDVQDAVDSASASATTATTKAAEAASSATDAFNYSSSAGTSATQAASSASQAATSANTAGSYATDAETAKDAAETAQAAAEAAEANINGLYLGSLANDPTLDGNGLAVTTGDLYFNTTENEVRVYTDNDEWIAVIEAGGDATFNSLTSNNDVVVKGNLEVQGTTITVDSATAQTIDLGDNDKIRFGDGDDLQIYHDGTDSYIANTTGTLKLSGNTDVTGNITVSGTVDGRDVAADGTKLDGIASSATANPNAIDNVVEDTTPQLGGVLDTNGNNIEFGDSTGAEVNRLKFGASDDLVIYHDGTHSYVTDNGTGNLRLKGYNVQIVSSGNETMGLFKPNEGASLWYDNSKKIETTSSGVDITGNITVSGTVDGRDIAADGTTLDAVASTYVDVSGDTLTGDLAFGDNVKATFGASDDLQIYHDGSNSIIRDFGTGTLDISTNGSAIRLVQGNGNRLVTAGYGTAGVKLWYGSDDTEKLATTSTGIDVTGTVTADGLTVDGNISGVQATFSANTPAIFFMESDRTDQNHRIRNSSGDLEIAQVDDSKGSALPRINIDQSGDIRFYDDAGTSQDFYWDASTSRLGLGTTSPDKALVVSGVGAEIVIDDTDTTDTPLLRFRESGSTSGTILTNSSNLIFTSGTTEAMRIDSNGRLGIGTSSPSRSLDVSSSSIVSSNFKANNAHLVDLRCGADASYNGIRFYEDDSHKMSISYIPAGDYIQIGTSWQSGNETLVVTESGNVGIGTTSPSSPLQVDRASTDGDIITLSKDGSTIGSIGIQNMPSGSTEDVLTISTNAGFEILNFIDANGDLVGQVCGGSSDLTIGTGDTGIRFNDGSNAIQPRNASTTTVRDASIDLGQSAGRFKNLYLSGGVYLGGTGSANLLDDYEEGTWTPTTASDATGVFSSSEGEYTKIGRLVFVSFVVNVSTNFTSNIIDGLPFTVADINSLSSYHQVGTCITGSSNTVTTVAPENSTQIRFFDNQNVNDSHTLNTTQDLYRVTISYQTT